MIVSSGSWRPRSVRPDLVVPVRAGRDGPTSRQAHGPRWRAVGDGWCVPATAAVTVEQRVLEVATVAGAVEGGTAAVAGWAALRWLGGAYFGPDDGAGVGTRVGAGVPVPVVDPARHLRAVPGRAPRRAALRDDEVVVVDGVRCVRPERALAEVVAAAASLEAQVADVDMAFAAELTSLRWMRSWAATARPVLRTAVTPVLALADEHVRSPPESHLRLRYQALGHPRPLCNPTVRTRSGGFVGVPDLLDVEAGLALEHDGRVHRSREQHRDDTHRRERFERAGLTVLVVVAGDLDDADGFAARVEGARRHALLVERRDWRLVPRTDLPDFTLDELVERRERRWR